MFKTGDLVISGMGRDQNRIFMIIEVIDENYVLMADGMLRKLEKPKRKKIKHLSYFGVCNDRILEKITENKKITNAELRKMIRSYDDMNKEKNYAEG